MPTVRDGARDAQDLSRTESSLGSGTVSAPRQRLSTQLTEFNRLRQSESTQDQELARRMLPQLLTGIRDLQEHPSTGNRELTRDYLIIRSASMTATEFLTTHRSRAGSAAFRREGAQLVDLQRARDQSEGSLRLLRQQVLLPSLPAAGTAPTIEQLRSARLAAAISRELGDLDAARSDCQNFRNLLSRLPRTALAGNEGHEFLDETLRFAVRCRDYDPMMGDIAFIAAHRVAWELPLGQREIGLYQFLAASQSMTGRQIERLRGYATRYLENRLSQEGLSTEVRSQRALEQGQAILWLRARGTEIETPAGVMTALRNGGGILARYAEALNPESRERPAEVLASLATRTPRTLSEHMAVRFGAEVRSQAVAIAASTDRAADPVQRALAGFDASAYNRAGRLEYYVGELRELGGHEGVLVGADLQRAQAALNSIRQVRAEIDGHLSADPQLQAFQLQGLLQADRTVLAMRHRLGDMYGTAPREMLGETDQAYAEANSRLERSIQSSTQALAQLRQTTLTTAQDTNGTLATRIQSYRLANQIDIALGSGNERVQDLSAWQTLMGQATDSDVSTADRFTDMGTILSGFHAMRQRRYDERSLDLRDTEWRWGDLVSPMARSTRDAQATVLAADPSRIQMSDADLTTHMTQARDSIVALLPIVNPPTDPLAQATNSQYQSELNLLISSRPGNPGAASDAARVLPMLSADGFVNFQSEPSVELALLDQLTTQANQHLTQGHVTIDTLRAADSTVSMENGQSRPLSDFIAGAENHQLTFSDAYRALSTDDRRRVIQQTLHLGRLGEYRATLAAETDPVRRHFRSAMLELEQGNSLRGQAELQTFLRDVRQPGETHLLSPIADPQLVAMRTVALDMNRRLMGQALDRLAQVSGELDAQRSENFAGFLDRDFGGNEGTIQALRSLINDPTMGFYSLDEALPVVRHQRIAAAQADFARSISADAPILLPCGPNVVGLHNIGNLTLPEISAMQQRQQALQAAAYRGMAVSGTSGDIRFGAEGLIPERNSQALFTAFNEHPEQALDGVPTVRLTPRGTITFAPHRGAPRGQTSILRVEIPPEGGFVMVESFRTGELQRTHFPPADGPRFVLLYQHHHLEGSSRRSGVVRPGDGDPPGTRTEFDPILNRVFEFEGYASTQRRSQSPDANRQASLDLASHLRTRGGSYTAAARIYEEVMGDAIHQAQLSIPQSELQRVTREAEAARPEVTAEIHRRVFQMIERGMPRPTQSQIDGMIEQAVQQRIQTQVRMLTFQRVRDRRDQLDPLARQAWDSYNDMMDPLDEWLNFSDSTMDRIIDEVVVNLAFTVASGGLGSLAGGATRAVATRMAARWLATEGTTLIGERAALWAASRGASSVAGRAILWTMGETATQSGRQIAARALIWGAGTVVEGTVFHASMTGMQSTWGFVRNGEWVFPPPGEFAVGAGHSILMMGSIGVGNAIWGRIGTELGVMPQQVERMVEASRAARMSRLAVHHSGQLATEVAVMTAVSPRPDGQSFTTAAAHNLATILELRAGGHIFHGLTGGRLQRYQQQIESEITQTRVRGIVQERFGLDPNSAEGRLMVSAIHHSMAEGQSIDAVSGMATRERLEVLRRSIRQELNVDPNSEQGQILTSLLLRHTMGRAGGPRGMNDAMLDVPGRLGELNRVIRGITERSGVRGEPADQISQSLLAQALSQGHTAESLQSLNASLTLLIEGGGFGSGEEAAQLRVTLLNHALATGQTHEQIADLARHSDGLRARIHDLTNQLYGEGAAATPFGRSVSSQLLTWALSQPGRPEELPTRLEALDDAMPQIIETIEGCNRDLGVSSSSLEGLQIFHHVLTWAMSGSHHATEIQQRLAATRREMPALRSSIGRMTQSLGYAEGTEGANRIGAALLLRLRGEAGSDSAFNRTELAAYLNSVGDFGRQIDLILSSEAGASLRPHRSRILTLAIQNSMTPEALNRLGQELHTGRRRLEISADGELHTVEDPTVAPVGEITLPTEPVAAPIVAGTGTQPLEAAARGVAPLAEPVVPTVLPERSVFLGDQIRDAREIANSAGLSGNEAFLRDLAALIVVTTRSAEQGFASGAERRRFLTAQLNQARDLARAAGQGENRALTRRLGELVRDTVEGAERGFAPAPESALATQPVEPSPRSLAEQRHLMAQIAHASGLLQARGSAGFFRSLMSAIESGRLHVTPEHLATMQRIFSDPRTQNALEQAHPMQLDRVRTALVYDILRGDLRGPADIVNYVHSILEHPTAFEGYSIGRGGVPARVVNQPMLPVIAAGAEGHEVLQRFAYLQGPDTGAREHAPQLGRVAAGSDHVVNDHAPAWTIARHTLETLSDPGLAPGPLANLARRTRAALQTTYERAREIQTLSSETPPPARLEAARRELTEATRTLEAWERLEPIWRRAYEEGEAMTERAAQPFSSLRLALEPSLSTEGTIHSIQQVRERIVIVESAGPEASELADAWLDPARGDQGRQPVQAGEVDIVVRNRDDIGTVADAAERRILAANIFGAAQPTIQRSTGPDGTVNLTFIHPDQPGLRYSVRVLEQSAQQAERTAAQARFERASRYEADETPIPPLRQPPPRVETESQQRATARPPRARPQPNANEAQGTQPGTPRRMAQAQAQGTGTPNEARDQNAPQRAEPILPPQSAEVPVVPSIPIPRVPVIGEEIPNVPAPSESGVRRTDRPRAIANEQPVASTGTEGPRGEQTTVRPAARPQTPGNEAPIAAAAVPPLPTTGPVGEAVVRGRSLAAGNSPIARHAQRAMERLAQTREGTPEFQTALTEVETLTEIANTAGLRLPDRGHPQHTSALAFQALARGAQVSLGRVEPGSPEYAQGLAAYRRGRDSVARDLVEAHRPAMENVLGFLREIGQGGDAWTQTHQRHPFLEAPRMAESIPPHGRLKAEADVLAKLNRRGWTSLEPMTDLAGTRAVVEGYEDVSPLLAAIQTRYTIREVRDGQGNATNARDRDGMRRLIEGARSGYRAIHVVVEIEGRPVEIQIQTRAMYEWGRIQHGLIYSEVRGSSGTGSPAATYTLTGPARQAVDAYCRQVAAHLADLEQGATAGARPSADAVVGSLPADMPAEARQSVMAELTRMDELMTATQRRFSGTQLAEESQGGAQIIAFRRPTSEIPAAPDLAQAAETSAPLALGAGGTGATPFVSPFRPGAEGAAARQTFARALEASLRSPMADIRMSEAEMTAARAYIEAVSRGEEPSAAATEAALDAFSYDVARTDGRGVPGGLLRMPAETPAEGSLSRAEVLAIDSTAGTITVRRNGQEWVLRGMYPGSHPFHVGQVVQFIPPIAGAGGPPFRMDPPTATTQVGEISPMTGATQFTVGREHGQSYDERMSRNHAIFRRGADGRWSVEDLGSLNGVNVLNSEGQPVRIPAGQPVVLQDGAAVQIGSYWYAFRPPLEPGVVISPPEIRTGTAEVPILVPPPGRTRVGLSGITVERAGDHWYAVSGETRIRINGQSRAGTNPLRDGDVIEVGGRSFRFQSRLPVRTYGVEGADVATIQVPLPNHALQFDRHASVVSGRVLEGEQMVELTLTSLRLPITQPPTHSASLLWMPRSTAEGLGFRFQSNGSLAAGSPQGIVMTDAPPAVQPHPSIEVVIHPTPVDGSGGPYRSGGSRVERVELPHPVDQAGNSYSIETDAVFGATRAQMQGRSGVVAHPVRTEVHPDGTAYVTFETRGQSGQAQRFVLRMSADQAREWDMTQGRRPARDYFVVQHPPQAQPVVPPRPVAEEAPPPEPVRVRSSDGQAYELHGDTRFQGPEDMMRARIGITLPDFFGRNARLLPASGDEINIEMDLSEVSSRGPGPARRTSISLPRTRALEMGIIRADGSLAQTTIGLYRSRLSGEPGIVRLEGGERFEVSGPSGGDIRGAREIRLNAYQGEQLAIVSNQGGIITFHGSVRNIRALMEGRNETRTVTFSMTRSEALSRRLIDERGNPSSNFLLDVPTRPDPEVLERSGLPTRRSADGLEFDLAALTEVPGRGVADPGWRNHPTEDLTGISAGSTEGTGYSDHNEDRYVVATRPDGRTVTVVLDGMGGMGGGERAASIARTVVRQAIGRGASVEQALELAHAAVVQENRETRGQGGAVAVSVEVQRTAEGDYAVEMRRIGDSDAAAFDLSTGAAEPILARTERHPAGQTQQIRLTSGSSVNSAIGSMRGAQEVTSLRMRAGQVLLAGSDGFWENFIDYAEVRDIMQRSPDRSAEGLRRTLMTEVQVRQQLLAMRGEGREPWRITPERYRDAYRSVTGREPPAPPTWRYIGSDLVGSRVIDPQGRPIGRFKADNVTLVVQVVGEPIVPRQAAPRPPVGDPARAQAVGSVPRVQPLQAAAFQPAQPGAAPQLVVVGVPPALGRGPGTGHPYRVSGPEISNGVHVYRLTVDERNSPGHVPTELEVSSPTPLQPEAMEGLLSPQRRIPGVEVRASYRDRIPLSDMPNGGSQAPLVDFYSVTDAADVASASSSHQPSVAIVDPMASGSASQPLFAVQRLGAGYRLFLRGEGVQVRDGQGRAHPPVPGNPRAFDLRPGDVVRFGITELTFDGQSFRLAARMGADLVSTEARLRVPAEAQDASAPQPTEVSLAIDAGGRRRFVEIPGVAAADGLRPVQIQSDSTTGMFRILRPGDAPLFITREYGPQAGERIEVAPGNPAILGEIGETVLVELGGHSYRMSLDDSQGSARLLPRIQVHTGADERSFQFQASERDLNCGPFILRVRESSSRPGTFNYLMTVTDPGGLTLRGQHFPVGQEIPMSHGSFVLMSSGPQAQTIRVELPPVEGMFPGWRR